MNRGVAVLLRALGIGSLLFILFQTVATSTQVVAPKDEEELAKRFTRTDVMIPMRDGVKLNTIIYAPRDRKEALPFIMMRTPYGIQSRGPKALKDYFKDLADDGYL